MTKTIVRDTQMVADIPTMYLRKSAFDPSISLEGQW